MIMQQQLSVLKENFPLNYRVSKDNSLLEHGIMHKTDPNTGELTYVQVNVGERFFVLAKTLKTTCGYVIRDLSKDRLHEFEEFEGLVTNRLNASIEQGLIELITYLESK